MWTVSFLPDPLVAHHRQGQDPSSITHARIALQSLIIDAYQLSVFQEGGRGARVALADIAARRLLQQRNNAKLVQGEHSVVLEPLDKALLNQRRRKAKSTISYPPYILERTDFWCSETELHLMVRVTESSTESEENIREQFVKTILTKIFDPQDQVFAADIMANVACVAFQQRLRSQLTEMKVVAFIADGSILPRKSGASMAPMASPPAIPFKAPADSTMSQDVKVDMGALCRYLPSHATVNGSTTVTLSGLVVPAGVTLIVGGGYHGKSTLLQTVAAGVYDKIPGDGREYCVAVQNAVSVRAEDGRYVNNCNVSAFISNLPTVPGVTKVLDTQHFSTRDSSGSTSQAANVSEAIEMGASALLVDEDISAANFMARDGRMRAMVMDESITPLLYRVNGLYNSFGISSVVVVGGVGDWLDVPHNVILLDKYVAFDATKKAASISYQFSHGHVQYAGRGVVHRLEWNKKGTPIPRRPADSFSKKYDTDVVVSVLDGGHAISLHKEEDEADEDAMIIDDDEDEGCIDASRFEQLLDRKQLYGCGLCVAWLLQAAPKHLNLGITDLLKKMDEALDQGGMVQLYNDVNGSPETHPQSLAWKHLVEYVGFATRPRTFEAGQALTRMRGIEMEELSVEEDEADLIEQREAEKKKKDLAALWAGRRSKSSGSS
jgi:hypothetical protein